MNNAATSNRVPRFSIALISATALSYEILLTRLFSIIQYHHFAYMIISLALLGYGVSGTLLSLFARPLRHHFHKVFLSCIGLFAISMQLCFLLAQRLPFNAEEVLWDWHQWLWLSMMYLLFMLPFLFAAGAIGLALLRFGQQISQLYAADMVGAGLGSLLIVALLFFVLPGKSLPILVLLGVATGLTACWELKVYQRHWLAGLMAAGVLPFLLPHNWLELQLSPYKSLAQLLQIDGTRIVATQSSPLGLLNVVESRLIPLRFAPGLSLNNQIEPPKQLAVFTDGDAMTAINQKVAHPRQLSFLDQQTSAAVYHLQPANKVLILGAGTGNDVLQARYQQVPNIDAVELNPQLTKLLTGNYREFSGDIYQQPGIQLHIAEARGFVKRSRDRFDVIQIALLDSHSAAAAGLYALSENYLYTQQAIQDYLARLSPDGYLSITRWIKLPPRDALKLAATVITALRDMGVNNPQQRIMLIRNWQTSTLLVKNSDISPPEIAALFKFCEQRLFDVAYAPGIEASQVNRYTILRQPEYYQALTQLLGKHPDRFIDSYKFNIAPATDNQPYFFNFFKWSLLPDIVQLRGKGGMPLVEWGYIVLVATLLQAVIASLVLILLPLLSRRTSRIRPGRPALIAALYFLILGLAFLFIEIAFMQKFALFLHHPIFAIAATLAAFLLFAGAGSHYSHRLCLHKGFSRSVTLAVTIIVVTGISYSLLLDSLLGLFLSAPIMVKIVLTAVLIAPLAFAMGMPFPLGLSYLNDTDPAMIPWAWGINGCASVISAILAMLLAIHMGFVFVIFGALALYVFAALLFTRLETAYLVKT